MAAAGGQQRRRQHRHTERNNGWPMRCGVCWECVPPPLVLVVKTARHACGCVHSSLVVLLLGIRLTRISSKSNK